MGDIIRVFRAVARSERADEFRKFFLEEAVNIVRQHQGLVSIQVGTSTEQAPNEFLMITT
jgi:quinol monooxygenase YgiN